MGTLIDFEEAKENVLNKIRHNPIAFQYDVLRKQLISMGMKEGSEALASVIVFVGMNSKRPVNNKFYNPIKNEFYLWEK
jgi:hypothetical protein